MERESISPTLVAIGSSAGGLEALRALLSRLPVEGNFCYVIAQHLAPQHTSMLNSLLSRDTAMPVLTLQERQPLTPNVVFVTPPNHNVVLRHDQLELVAPFEKGPKPSIDELFVSISESAYLPAVGILLSGSGSDGTLGARRLKASGGYIIAQEPRLAKYPSMPQSAISAGCVDWVLPAEEIGPFLSKIPWSPQKTPNPASTRSKSSEIERILEKISLATQIDFRGYKQNTLNRRINQRLIATQCNNLEEYINLLDSNRDEVLQLARACLVSVTGFFREKHHFEALGALIATRPTIPANQAYRVWVPACATGEEAFSLSILLGNLFPNNRIQIFGTDLDEAAITVARRAWYPRDAVMALPPEIIAAHFVESGSGFTVERTVRDRVVFARHDLLRDPLFLNLDLISCRNLLIYLKPALQEEVMRKFHHALHENGLLFLGRSEHAASEYFDQLDRRSRIYANKPVRPNERRLPVTRDWNGWERTAKETTVVRPVPPSISDVLLRHFAPAAVLTDTSGQIVDSIGDLSRILRFPSGKPHFTLLNLVPRALAPSLRAQMQRAQKTGAVVNSVPRRIEEEPEPFLLETTVIPHPLPGGESGLLVCFQMQQAPQRTPHASSLQNEALVAELERELAATREGLHAAVEQLETSNDELQSLNEELHAANEELQAAIEELQSSNEELQSTNEELITVNEELEHKTIELSYSIEDLENIQDTLNGALIVIDSRGCIRSLNNEARQLFQLSSNDIGSPFHLPHHPTVSIELAPHLREILVGGDRLDFDLMVNAISYRVTLRPYLSQKKASRGAILLFQENSALATATSRLNAAEAALRAANSRQSAILDALSTAIALLDAQGQVQTGNQSWLQLCGEYPDADFLTLCGTAFSLSAKARSDLRQALQLLASGAAPSYSCQLTARLQGAPRWFQLAIHALGSSPQAGFVASLEDVSAEVLLSQRLHLQAAALQSSGHGILIINLDGRIDWVNPALLSITCRSEDQLLRQHPLVLESPHCPEPFQKSLDQCRLAGQPVVSEVELQRASGAAFTARRVITPILSSEGSVTQFVVTIEDITEQRAAEAQLKFLASHDQLTSLLNRQAFLTQLESAIARQSAMGGRIAILFLDLDRFKDTNDTLGHLTGDRILIEIAHRLRSSLTGPETLARFGGDEFVLFLEGFQALDYVEATVSRILSAINRPIELEGRSIYLSGSLGITIFPQDGQSAEQLLRNADLAMYRAKATGRRGYRYFDQLLATEISQRVAVENDLAGAISSQKLWVAFQPQVELQSNRIAGVESLLRWSGATVHQIPIDRVIAIAEETGLILSIGEWVIRQSLEQLAAWQRRQAPLKVSINLSAVQFNQQDVFGILMQTLREFSLPPNSVKVEITESVLLNRSSRVRESLHAFHGAGIGLILDDFGTGYSSLTYLREYPIESVKIDSSFLCGIGHNSNDEAIVRGIIQLAHSLGQQVIAEGVENRHQLDFLRDAKCDYAQGFLFSQPLAAEDFDTQFGSVRILQ
jgi:two-component system CheB/CheR fusion protein